VTHEHLFSDHLSALVRKDHPIAKRKTLELSDVLSAQWLLPDSTTLARKMIDDFFEARGINPPAPSIESSDIAMIREILCGSDIVAITTRSQMMVEIDSGGLVELPLRLEGTTREVSLILREGAMLSPAAKTVVDALRAEARSFRTKGQGKWI
jgi:LysR family transcriptional regulator of gallate degradation